MLQDVLDRGGLLWDGVAVVEAEGVAEGVFTEPDLSESVQETFVQIIGDSAAVLHLP